MIYVASPYSGTEDQMQSRALSAMTFVAAGTRLGLSLYSPIVHFNDMARLFGLRTDFEFWSTINFDHIDVSRALVVLALEGWERSVGVTAEVEFARARGIPVQRTPEWTVEQLDGDLPLLFWKSFRLAAPECCLTYLATANALD